ncbi:MAG: TonB-dependent receptor plug domain-containing protein, partial [Gemmatimonadota bacterium]
GGSSGVRAPVPEDEVSVGFDTQSEDGVTGAITSIRPSEVEGDYANVGELLRGRVPGLEVLGGSNGGYRIRIRGAARLSGDSGEPLLVVDGMRISSQSAGRVLATLRPHEVVRIDVLRDTASTSIYGNRGQAGVIVITTEAGR